LIITTEAGANAFLPHLDLGSAAVAMAILTRQGTATVQSLIKSCIVFDRVSDNCSKEAFKEQVTTKVLECLIQLISSLKPFGRFPRATAIL
jgi:hypothetical protein